MYEIFVNLTCISKTPVFRTQKLIPKRFSLDWFHCYCYDFLF